MQIAGHAMTWSLRALVLAATATAVAAVALQLPTSMCIPEGSYVSTNLLSLNCYNSLENLTSYAPTMCDAWKMEKSDAHEHNENLDLSHARELTVFQLRTPHREGSSYFRYCVFERTF